MLDTPLKTTIQLLQNENIKDELYLTSAQVRKLLGALAKIRQELIREMEKSLDEILTPEQNKRFKEVRFQIQGIRAFSDTEVQSQLQLTDDQREQIRRIVKNGFQHEAVASQENSPEKARQNVIELRKRTMEQVTAVLTDKQKSQWEEMRGEDFEHGQETYLMRSNRLSMRSTKQGMTRATKGQSGINANGEDRNQRSVFAFDNES
jgi:hypothetical protein